MRTSRRSLLGLVAGSATATLAGCSTAARFGRDVTISVVNETTDAHSLTVHVFRTDRTERSDALVYRDTFDLPGTDTAAEPTRVTKRGVLDARRYDVRFRLDDVTGLQNTERYYPDCLEANDVEPGFQLRIGGRVGSDRPAIEFQQSRCSGDAWWY